MYIGLGVFISLAAAGIWFAVGPVLMFDGNWWLIIGALMVLSDSSTASSCETCTFAKREMPDTIPQIPTR